jgi:cell division topological specificity factor
MLSRLPSLLWPFGARSRNSAALAKQRLQIVISQQRQTRPPRAPDYLPALQRELQLVVAKYIDVPPRQVTVRFAQPRHAPQGLEVRIELPLPSHA